MIFSPFLKILSFLNVLDYLSKLTVKLVSYSGMYMKLAIYSEKNKLSYQFSAYFSLFRRETYL